MQGKLLQSLGELAAGTAGLIISNKIGTEIYIATYANSSPVDEVRLNDLKLLPNVNLLPSFKGI